MASLIFSLTTAATPSQFGTGDWSVTNDNTGGDATLTITALPSDGGSAITDLQRQIDGGAWVSLGGTTTGSYDLDNLFTDGVQSTVAVRAVNAAGNGPTSATKSVTTSAPGSGTGTVTISILSRMSTEVAPESIAFGAAITGATVSEPASREDFDPTAHDVVYVWDYGDSANAQSDKVVNLPSTWNNMNKGEGKYTVHTFASPGNYTVTCTAYERDGTLIGSDTQPVTIVDPATLFAGARTIAVAADGNFAGAPAGATQETNLTDAIQAMVDQAVTCRILLKRGESYPVPGNQISLFGFHPNIYFGAWGTGARPVLQGDGTNTPGMFLTFSSFAGKSMVFDGIKFQGTWDSVNETGNSATSGIASQGVNITVTDCVMDGINYGVSGGGTIGDNVVCGLHNTEITNFVNFGFGGGSDGVHIGIVGCAIYHDPNANEGLAGSSSGPGNRHGPIRMPSGPTQYVACNDLFSRSGWAGTHQPCIRPISTVYPGEVTYCHIARNAMEGGDISIQATHNTGESGTANINSLNLIVENNLAVGTFISRGFLSTQFPGTTSRNNLYIMPNTPKEGAGEMFFLDDWGSLTILNPADNHKVYNNTYVSQLNSTNRNSRTTAFLSSDAGSRWTNFDADNNVFQSPNETGLQSESALLTAGTIVTVGGTWSSRMLGRKRGPAAVGVSTQETMDATYATPASGVVADNKPGPGSPLIDDSTGETTVFDPFGNQAGSEATRDRGWAEA